MKMLGRRPPHLGGTQEAHAGLFVAGKSRSHQEDPRCACPKRLMTPG